MSRQYFIFTGIFISVCVVLCVCIWYSLSELYALREEYERLSSDNHTNSGLITNLETRNSALSRISGLSINNARAISDAVAFFSMVSQTIEANNITLLNMTTSGQNNAGKKSNTLQLKINGDYYSMAKMFADWRTLPVPSKITRLELRRNHTLPEELVEADVTLQVMTEE